MGLLCIYATVPGIAFWRRYSNTRSCAIEVLVIDFIGSMNPYVHPEGRLRVLLLTKFLLLHTHLYGESCSVCLQTPLGFDDMNPFLTCLRSSKAFAWPGKPEAGSQKTCSYMGRVIWEFSLCYSHCEHSDGLENRDGALINGVDVDMWCRDTGRTRSYNCMCHIGSHLSPLVSHRTGVTIRTVPRISELRGLSMSLAKQPAVGRR